MTTPAPSPSVDPVRERIAAMLAGLELSEYLPFDQDTKLPPPPWKPTDQPLIDWEAAHGHDVRLKCYPEFGCQVIGADAVGDLSLLAAALTAVLDKCRAADEAEVREAQRTGPVEGLPRRPATLLVSDIRAAIAAGLGVTP